MFEYIVLGVVQGLAEWLPVSSEGMIVLVQSYFFNSVDLTTLIATALYLHLGTVLAASIYFRNELVIYIKSLLSWKEADEKAKQSILFFIITTAISGGLGIILLKRVVEANIFSNFSASAIMFGIGLLLLITGALQFVKEKRGTRNERTLTLTDGVVLGVAQGFAVLPGLSRSGLTVAALLLRNFDKETALRLSFIMSIPIVVAGNIVLAAADTSFSLVGIVGLITAGIVGYITIDVFIKVARKVNFGYFVIGFGLLTVVSVFI